MSISRCTAQAAGLAFDFLGRLETILGHLWALFGPFRQSLGLLGALLRPVWGAVRFSCPREKSRGALRRRRGAPRGARGLWKSEAGGPLEENSEYPVRRVRGELRTSHFVLRGTVADLVRRCHSRRRCYGSIGVIKSIIRSPCGANHFANNGRSNDFACLTFRAHLYIFKEFTSMK